MRSRLIAVVGSGGDPPPAVPDLAASLGAADPVAGVIGRIRALLPA